MKLIKNLLFLSCLHNINTGQAVVSEFPNRLTASEVLTINTMSSKEKNIEMLSKIVVFDLFRVSKYLLYHLLYSCKVH